MAAQQLVQFGPYRLDGANGQPAPHPDGENSHPGCRRAVVSVTQAGQVVPKKTCSTPCGLRPR